ncbi:MAG: 5'-methylthioadenosine phosphorylase [Bradymonadia bacterium]
MATAVILGSAFQSPTLAGDALEPVPVATRAGEVTLYRLTGAEAYVLFRHGLPHDTLPHHIPWRAHALALKAVGCDRLLITSSVGVLTAELPLFEPLVVTDLLMPDNRLPDGTACTVFHPAGPGQGHLVLDEGLCNRALSDQLRQRIGEDTVSSEVVFTYVGGPRTKTAAENRWWAAQGAHVNSMTVGPELVMANELGIATAVAVVGHKYSGPASDQQLDTGGITASLEASRGAMAQLSRWFLTESKPVQWANRIYTFDPEPHQ